MTNTYGKPLLHSWFTDSNQSRASTLGTASNLGHNVFNLFDVLFNGMGGSEMYRAQIFPELWPNEKRMLVERWSVDDREMYCGRN